MDLLLARQLRERHSAPRRVPADRTVASGSLIEPFDVLYEADLPRYALPSELERIYGPIGFEKRAIFSNFVASIDGVVTLGSTPSAGSVISGRNPADRFLMGLLRACADAVLLGAGTLRATPGHHWTPQHIYPDAAALFAELRRSLGRKANPRLVLFTASGDVDVSHPAVIDGATVVTGARGATALRDRLPEACDILEADLPDAIKELRDRGLETLLTEGGPHLMGELVTRGLLDEAFLTISPVVAGRDRETRLGMIAGAELLPGDRGWSRLQSARRHGDYLFLRYDLRKSARP